MFKINLRLIIRNIWKYKGFSIINISGLSIGMACSIIILLWVQFHLSFDKFQENGDNVYRVIQHIKFIDYTTWTITQGPLGPSLKEEVPEVAEYCRLMRSGMQFKKGEELVRERGTYADPSFFSLFTIKVTKKLKNSPVSEPNNIAISERLAQKYFGNENPIGKTLRALPNRDFLVTAVFKDYPKESHIWFDYVIPFEYLGGLGYTINEWGNSGYTTYISLKEGVTKEQAVSKIEDFLIPKPNLEEFAKLDLQPIQDIHLTKGYDFETANTVDRKYVNIFLIIGVLLIIVACINFMNLATARSSRRAREIGMKKVSGAHKSSLIFQFIGEAVLISSIAIIFAMMLVEIMRPTFNTLMQIGLNIDYFDYKTYLYLLSLVLITGIIAGSYPAFFLASLKPNAILKGSASGVAKKFNFRKILVVFQFTVSIIMITSTLFVTFQINYMLNKDLGYDKEGIIYFDLSEGFHEHFESIKSELLKSPGVLKMTRAASIPTSGVNFSNSRFRWEGQDLSKETLFRATYADYDFFSTYNMKIIEGREFSKEFASDSSAIILNEAAVKAIGFENPVGKQLWIEGRSQKLTVVGVVKDFNYKSLHTEVESQIIIFDPRVCYNAVLKINLNDFEAIRKKLEVDWRRFETQAKINISFLDESLANLYKQDNVLRIIILFFASIGIFISILGLIGMTGYTIEQKTKEIGIRKSLGASFKTIILLLSSDFIKWILISFVLAVPITYYLISKWLATFAYRISMSWWVFILGGAIALIIAIITISLQTSKAARINPADSLRYE